MFEKIENFDNAVKFSLREKCLSTSYFWSAYPCSRTKYRKYGPEITPYLDTFHFSLFNSVFVDDKFGKPFKTYLGENAVYNFINNMIEESKYCSDVMKKYFNKKFVMTKEDKI